MKRIFLFCLILSLLTSCRQEEPLVRPVGAQEKGVLRFGFSDFSQVDIRTRAELPPSAESLITDLCVLIFDEDGNVRYKRYFDHKNRKNAENDVLKAGDWYVENKSGGHANHTMGTLRFDCPELTNGHLYLFANVTGDIVDISKERLRNIRTEDELKELSVQYTQHTILRQGLLLMEGRMGVTISQGDITPTGTMGSDINEDTWGELPGDGPCLRLRRVDAKVKVKVGVVPGAVTHTTSTDPVTGESVDIYQEIESFEPTSWQVLNLPRACWLLSHDHATLGAAYKRAPVDENDKAFRDSDEHFFDDKETESNAKAYTEVYIGDKAHSQETTAERTVHNFCFYTLETHSNARRLVDSDSAQAAYPNIPSFYLRDKRQKHTEGENIGQYFRDVNDVGKRDIWEFAPPTAPVLVIKGNVKMKYDASNNVGQTLNADVVYYIHLGDFSTNPASSPNPKRGLNNYCLDRNTEYTYHINIKGVNAIEVEVNADCNGDWENTNETQSGATGKVYVSQEEIHTFDAHYGQRAYKFNADKLLRLGAEIEDLTWAVYTPFGRNGMPDRVGVQQVEVPNGLDYQWVYFLQHSREATYVEPPVYRVSPDASVENENGAGRYSHKNRWYPGDQEKGESLKDVLQLCDYLRTEGKKYRQLREDYVRSTFATNHPDENYEETKLINGDYKDFNALVNENTGFDLNHEVWFTAFVNEFYYDMHPISHNYITSLWHQFANQPDRAMHIMCDSRISKDGESLSVGTGVSLYQHSIQTIFNTNTAAEGWGVETVDESRGNNKFFNRDEEVQNGDFDEAKFNKWNLEDVSCDSKDNGRYNSACLLGMVDGNAMTSETFKWVDFLDFSRTNEEMDNSEGNGFFINNDPQISTLRYNWLERNRDNNGNGVIDEDEIRWYFAALNQLKDLYIGQQGIVRQAWLYNLGDQPNETITNAHGDSYLAWRSHVVSSTKISTDGTKNKMMPAYLWAEEGVSYSPYGLEWGKHGLRSMRCLRNLDNYTTHRTIQDKEDFPLGIVEMTEEVPGDVYVFDLSRMNDASKNINISKEPLPMDENSVSSCPVNRFRFSRTQTSEITFLTGTYHTTLQPALNRGDVISPEGWRTPSLREMTVVYNMIEKELKAKGVNTLGCANYYSFGKQEAGGNNYDIKGMTWGFEFNNGNITIEGKGNHTICCVQTLR